MHWWWLDPAVYVEQLQVSRYTSPALSQGGDAESGQDAAEKGLAAQESTRLGGSTRSALHNFVS